MISTNAAANPCTIGTPGQKWGPEERATWLAQTTIKRSYKDDVLSKLEALKTNFDVVQYGELSYSKPKYPLFAVKTRQTGGAKPTVLVTGGVHGYETSGVHGALTFLETKISKYTDTFNFVVAPCVSPWGYETKNRWNPSAVDPNRSFTTESASEEAKALMDMVASLGVPIIAHFDLHETTDSDESEFRPFLSARDGEEYVPGEIPDGFYTVGDTENPQPELQAAIIKAVKQVTHIAPADRDGNLIGSKMEQEGVINYPLKELFLCAGLTDAKFVTTTEVYPDSPNCSAEECNLAQVAALTGALDFVQQALLLRQTDGDDENKPVRPTWAVGVLSEVRDVGTYHRRSPS
eukprot:CAMPEP_0198197588 /NCGR_PEP_ID=MMETSP1445-20131203/1150_1 /TAXON_ID=36898 /ORGANISM="Pyramimonas sp., Strain CCMP2087" /LENGTH=348 /DNA_ID=CAMNT_0043866903 /DNA_START=281 /DNA_END=1328 /DNA_ORIENTATION=+